MVVPLLYCIDTILGFLLAAICWLTLAPCRLRSGSGSSAAEEFFFLLQLSYDLDDIRTMLCRQNAIFDKTVKDIGKICQVHFELRRPSFLTARESLAL